MKYFFLTFLFLVVILVRGQIPSDKTLSFCSDVGPRAWPEFFSTDGQLFYTVALIISKRVEVLLHLVYLEFHHSVTEGTEFHRGRRNSL